MVQSKAEEDKARATRRIEEKLKRQMNRLERILPEAIARRLGDFKAGRVTGAGDIGGFPLEQGRGAVKGVFGGGGEGGGYGAGQAGGGGRRADGDIGAAIKSGNSRLNSGGNLRASVSSDYQCPLT
jgi:hypothetical protein